MRAATPFIKTTLRFKGNFEQHHKILPRYFLVTLELKNKEYQRQIIDSVEGSSRFPIVTEHSDKVQNAVSA